MSTEISKKIRILKPWQRIYVNRTLNLGKIRAVGFDMDHTLALYIRENFEELAFKITLDKAIAQGYPEALRILKFDPKFIIRGLLLDIQRGNLLKVDCHKYVKLAYHGRRLLSREERADLYNKESFKADGFISADTFFSLSETQLYVEVVDYMAQHPGVINKSYAEVYTDIRYLIDLSHRDGSIKSEVSANTSRYVRRDEKIADTLAKLRDSGKITFLLTNSYWEYTNHIMGFLLGAQWVDFFDVVIVGSNKPSFFNGKQPFYQVIQENGLLKIHDGPLLPGHVYHGGNATLLQKNIQVRGDEILYVGDHIYGDIFQSKDRFNWRTMLVIEELNEELKQLDALKKSFFEIRNALKNREAFDEQLHLLSNKKQKISVKVNHDSPLNSYKVTALAAKSELIEKQIETCQQKIRDFDKKIDELMEKRSQALHPIWGELMRTSLERSRFADQVTDYACIYSSKATNLVHYNSFKKFTSAKDRLPHEG